MITSLPLPRLRQLRSALAGHRPALYTADEVAVALSPVLSEGLESDRKETILACAACPSEWLSYLDERAAWELGRAADKLPSLVFWRRVGLPMEEMGRRLNLLGGAWHADRALAAAERCIAARLNDRGRPAVRGAA